MPLPTWDIFIGFLFIAGIAYGFILRREKTITTLCSTYIGLVVATGFSKYVFDFLNGNRYLAGQIWIHSNASLSTVTIIVFLAITFLVSGTIISTSNRSGDVSPFEVIIYSTLTMALIISSILGFLPEEVRMKYVETSKLASFMLNMKTLWIILPPIALVILNFRRK